MRVQLTRCDDCGSFIHGKKAVKLTLTNLAATKLASGEVQIFDICFDCFSKSTYLKLLFANQRKFLQVVEETPTAEIAEKVFHGKNKEE